MFDMFSKNPPKEELQRFQDADPFQHHEDPPVVDVGVGAGEIGEQDTRVFRIAGAHGDGHCFESEDVVCHDTLGDTLLGGVNAFNRVSP